MRHITFFKIISLIILPILSFRILSKIKSLQNVDSLGFHNNNIGIEVETTLGLFPLVISLFLLYLLQIIYSNKFVFKWVHIFKTYVYIYVSLSVVSILVQTFQIADRLKSISQISRFGVQIYNNIIGTFYILNLLFVPVIILPITILFILIQKKLQAKEINCF